MFLCFLHEDVKLAFCCISLSLIEKKTFIWWKSINFFQICGKGIIIIRFVSRFDPSDHFSNFAKLFSKDYHNFKLSVSIYVVPKRTLYHRTVGYCTWWILVVCSIGWPINFSILNDRAPSGNVVISHVKVTWKWQFENNSVHLVCNYGKATT